MIHTVNHCNTMNLKQCFALHNFCCLNGEDTADLFRGKSMTSVLLRRSEFPVVFVEL